VAVGSPVLGAGRDLAGEEKAARCVTAKISDQPEVEDKSKKSYFTHLLSPQI
jgi:hypothetical protein